MNFTIKGEEGTCQRREERFKRKRVLNSYLLLFLVTNNKNYSPLTQFFPSMPSERREDVGDGQQWGVPTRHGNGNP